MTQDKGVTGLEKQLKSAEKEFAVAQQKMSELLKRQLKTAAARKRSGRYRSRWTTWNPSMRLLAVKWKSLEKSWSRYA